MNVSAVILAGGASARMGRDKAFLSYQGQTLLERAAALLDQFSFSARYISGRPGVDYSSCRYPVVFDLEPGFGPLGGIERGLHLARGGLVLFMPVDMPAAGTELIRWLLEQAMDTRGVVPIHEEMLEPLVAIYPHGSHSIAQAHIAQKRLAARDFAEACAQADLIKLVKAPSEISGSFSNVNTPSDVENLAASTHIQRRTRS